MNRSSRFPATLVLILFAVTVICILTTFAGYVGQYRYLEITGDYRPYQLVIGLIALMAALTLHRFRVLPRLYIATIGLATITAVVNGLEVLPWLFASRTKPEAASAGTALKAIAFNVEGSNTRFSETRDFVRREAPDVVMFCESVGRWPEELRSLEEILPHHVRVNEMAIEVFSRHPIARTQIFHFGTERGFVAVELEFHGAPVTFVAAHAYPRYWRGAEGFRRRTSMLEDGFGKQATALRHPLLIMGDLNASPWSPAYKAMRRASHLRDARRGFGLTPTHHGHGALSKWLWRPIDHCLHTDDTKILSFRTGPDLGSDHRPIIVDCVLPPSGAPKAH